MTFKDKLWLWGQSPDAHWEDNNTYKLPGHSRMSAVEGCYYFGIDNICRVRMMRHPMPPYDQESEAMRPCKKVVWSLLGAGGEPVTDWGDLEEVVRQAKMYDNIVGGVFDDFFLPNRLQTFTPERLAELKKKMCADAGRPLEMWVVCYEDKLDSVENIGEYLKEFDVITFWTWCASALGKTEENIERIRALSPKSRIMAGCSMWNYGEQKPMADEEMRYQTELYHRLLKEGRIDGIIVCSNCIADLGIEAVEYMRQYISEHSGEEI